MKLLALLLLLGCQKDTGVSTGSGSAVPPPGPGHLDLDLPKAAHGGDEVVTYWRISISKDAVFINGDNKLTLTPDMASPVIADGIAKALPAPSDPRTKIIIAADRHVEYGVVVAVIDGVKQRGYSAIALESAVP